MTLYDYAQEVFDYMSAKLPDVNQATLYEITEFFVFKSSNFASDAVTENSKQWSEELKKYGNQMDRLLKRAYKR